MSENYIFEFSGTKENFLSQLNKYPNNNQKFFYFDDYIVEISDDEVRFGVERIGHAGGRWFVPTITECDGKTIFSGTIQYIGPKDDSSTDKSFWLKRMGEFLLYILMLPLGLVLYAVVMICDFSRWLFNKKDSRPTLIPKSTEERLCELMENYLNCTRK